MKKTCITESERIKNNPDVSYEDLADKVIARLKSYNSAVYTRLANRVEEIAELEKQIKVRKEEVKSLAREHVAGLFDADDATKTRVIDTISLIITLSKDPKPTVTYQYAKIFEELNNHLTPELIMVLEDLKQKFTSVTQKEPSFKVQQKEDPLSESKQSKFTEFFKKYARTIKQWGRSYDRRLFALKAEAGLN